MATSIFDNKEYRPDDGDVRNALGSCFALWENLMDYFYESHEIVETDWKFYSKNSGWCLKIFNEKGKNLAFLLPNDEHFIVTINMSVKSRDEILNLNLSQRNISLLKEAKVFSEGISVLFLIKVRTDLSDVLKVLSYKG